MATAFREFLDRVVAGDGYPPDAERRFVPPARPPAHWSAVRDDLEQTLASLQELRAALFEWQRRVDAAERAREELRRTRPQRPPPAA